MECDNSPILYLDFFLKNFHQGGYVIAGGICLFVSKSKTQKDINRF